MNLKKYLLLGSFLTTGFVSAQFIVPEKKFNDLLRSHNYDEVIRQATQLRGDVFGKNVLLDYYIARSFCLKGQQDEAATGYNRIRKNYNLSSKQIKFLQTKLSNCGQEEDLETPDLITASNSNYINNTQLPIASVGGKMGIVFNCYSNVQYSYFDSLVSRQEFESRLFGLDERRKAYLKLKDMLGNDYEVDSAGRFMLVTTREYSMSSKQVSQTMEQLEKTFRFYISYFNLRFPDKLLTVYLMPDYKRLTKLAQKIHHLNFPSNQLGYSCAADLSLVGIADPSQLATLFHELFHIVIRTDVGDIPAWLDEGLASLYTISHWEGNQLLGNFRPWRWGELRKAAEDQDFAMQVPTLRKLIDYDWHEFNGIEDTIFNLCRAATDYAYSNFLMIYLQEKNQLPMVVNSFKNRPTSANGSPIGIGDNVFILESALGIDIDTLNKNYDSWLALKENITIRRDRSWRNVMFENFEQKIERCDEGLHAIKYIIRNSKSNIGLQIKLDSLQRLYHSNTALLKRNEGEIKIMVENATTTFLTIPNDRTTSLAQAIIFYNQLTELEMDIRKLLFSEKTNRE